MSKNRLNSQHYPVQIIKRRSGFTGSNLVKKSNRSYSPEKAENLQLIGSMTAGVAHDFNNLLTAIIGNSQVALSRLGDNEKVKSNIKEIEQAGLRAAKLAELLLKFSRGEKIQLEILNVNQTISDLLDIIARIVGKEIKIRLELAHSLDDVYASATNIERIIVNLCVNARDAMPQGGEIDITTANVVAQNRSFVLISVRDTGSGIDSRIKKRIFDEFFTTKPQGKGNGMGLSNVRHIVRQHNGQIKCRSKLGEGTVFEIFLPAVINN